MEHSKGESVHAIVDTTGRSPSLLWRHNFVSRDYRLAFQGVPQILREHF